MSVESKRPQQFFHDTANESICGYLEEIIKNWEGVRKGQDVEAVHDMRVATRRLRAALSVFQPIFPPRLFDKFERKISYLTDALGDARDTDVFLQYISDEIAHRDPSEEKQVVGLKEFAKHLKKLREEQQSDLMKTLKRLDPDELRHDGEALLYALSDLRRSGTEHRNG